MGVPAIESVALPVNFQAQRRPGATIDKQCSLRRTVPIDRWVSARPDAVPPTGRFGQRTTTAAPVARHRARSARATVSNVAPSSNTNAPSPTAPTRTSIAP